MRLYDITHFQGAIRLYETEKHKSHINPVFKIAVIYVKWFMVISQNLYKNKYQTDTARLKYFDYGSNANYFITICTKDRIHHFGEIIKNEIVLSDIGLQAEKCWLEIPKHFHIVHLHDLVIMPNHIHGIIEIDKTKFVKGTDVVNDGVETHPAETQNIASLQIGTDFNKFGPQSQNLPSIIRGFKIGVTKWCRTNTNIHDVWQSKYHEHVIRDIDSYGKIQQYIQNNVLCWEDDEMNK